MKKVFYPEADVNRILEGNTIFEGALLLADISGFTEITESLSEGGKRGTEELTVLLNRCFDAMLEVVDQHGGAVITFSGDSILARFDDPSKARPCGKNMLEALRDFRRVIILGRHFSIRAKTVIGTGEWMEYVIGSPGRAHILVTGELVRELARREQLASAGETVAFHCDSTSSEEHYQPPAVEADSFISTGSERLHGEHRAVTPVFLRIKPLEGASWTISGFQEFLPSIQSVVEAHGGHLHHIDGMVSSGVRIMALFGAPVSMGRDSFNAVLSALEILAKDHAMYRVACGIDTGYAFSGMIGNARRGQYTVIGDCVNTASRISGKALPGTVLVSSGVVKKTSNEIRYGKPQELLLQGKKRPMEVFHAEENLSGMIREPFVGRESELAELMELAQAGNGPLLLSGSAGIGKTSLLAELERRLSARGISVCRGYAGSGGAGGAILTSLLMSVCGIQHSMTADEKLSRLDAILDGIGTRQLTRRRVFLANMLLRLGVQDFDFNRMPPRLRKENLHDAMVLLLSGIRPCVIIEDVHRAGEEEIDSLLKVIRGVHEVTGCFFLLSSREEGESKVPPEACPERMKLGEFPPEWVSRLLEEYSDGMPVHGEVCSLLAERTGGNPFYLIQFFHYLRDRELIALQDGHWVKSGRGSFDELPESVFSMIMARIDILAETTRDSLKVASVVGMRFSEEVLSRLVSRDVHSDMSESMKAGLTFINSYIELEHIFSHTLIRDVAYDSILSSRRRKLHAEIGRILEESSRDPEASSAFLAMHFMKGEDWDRAVKYSIMAGESADEEYRNQEAVFYYTQAAEVLKEHLEEDKQRLSECIYRCGIIHDRTGDFEKAREFYRRAVSISRDGRLSQRSLMGIADILFNQGNIAEAMELVDEVERLVQQDPDVYQDTMVQVKAFRAWTYCIEGNLDQAEEYALDAVRRGELLDGFTEEEKARKLGHALNTLATVHWAKSDMDGAREFYERAIDLALANGLKREAAVTWGNIGLTLEKQGRYSEAVESIGKQLRTAVEIGEKLLILSAHGDLCMTYISMGDLDSGLEHGTRHLELAGSLDVAHDQVLALNHLSYIHIIRGSLRKAAVYISDAFRILEDRPIERELAKTFYTSGKLAIAENRLDDAESDLERSLELAEKVNSLAAQHMALLQTAELHLLRGDGTAAMQAVDRASAISEKTGMAASEASCSYTRGLILERAGRKDEALKRYCEAEKIFRELGTKLELARTLQRIGGITGDAMITGEASALFDEMGVPSFSD